MGWPSSLFLLLVFTICNGQDLVEQVCMAGKSSVMVGESPNVLIGGLFEMRQPGSSGYGCGQPNLELMQLFEAARFTIDSLNSGSGYIPGVTFGMQVYDTCSQESVTLNALQMMYPQSTTNEDTCADTNNVVIGSVGSLSSSTSIPAANYAGSIPASLISPKAAAYELSDKLQYPTFLRTTPSDAVLGSVVVELLKNLQWEENVLLVYSDNVYGQSGYASILQAANAQSICIGRAVAVDVSQMDKNSIRDALSNAVGSNSHTAGIIMASAEEAVLVLEAVDEVASLATTQWILSDLDVTSDLSSLTRARGAMVVFPASASAPTFQSYFVGLESNLSSSAHAGNPWFYDWYEEKYKCSIGAAVGGMQQCADQSAADVDADFMLSPWAVSTMKAVAAYAEASRLACLSTATCKDYLAVVSPDAFHDILKDLDITFPADYPVVDLRGQRVQFDASGDPVVTDFSVYNYNNRSGDGFHFEKIGDFQSDALTLTQIPVLYTASRDEVLATLPTASCPADTGCVFCLSMENMVTFRYTPGDIVLASLASGHTVGSTSFTCGEGTVPGLAALIASEWAISQYKVDNAGKLAGVSLGSLVADVCPDGPVVGGFLADLLSGNNRLMGSSGNIIRADDIYGFVDQTSGDQAAIVSPVLDSYSIPEIQTASQVMPADREDSAIHGVPTRDELYEAISALLLRLGWNYVQVATQSSLEYQDTVESFRRIAGSHGICVLDVVDIDAGVDDAVDQLLSLTEVSVVVVIADNEHFTQLTTELNNKGALQQLQLIAGTEDPMSVPGYTSITGGNTDILVRLEIQQPSNDFLTWLAGLSQTEIAAHPFARELFEMIFECSLVTSTRGNYQTVCDPSNQFGPATEAYFMGKTPYVIESVYAIADNLHEVIGEVCGDVDYTELCSEFRSADNIGSLLEDKLQDIDKEDGFGIRDRRSTTDIIFYTVTDSVTADFATFNTEDDRLTSFSSPTLRAGPATPTCSGPCVECQYLFTLQSGAYIPGDWLIGGIFSVSESGPEQYQPYMCGDIRTTNGPQYTTAMVYALEQVNAGAAPVSVRGVTFGGFALDHCNNDNRANLLVSSIYSNYYLELGMEQTQLLSWLTDNTGATQEAEALLDPLGVAVVSPSATSDDLMQYDNFYRTIQGDQTVATALAKIIGTLELPYFQVVYSGSGYGQGGLDSITSAAQTEGICVSHSVKVEGTSTAQADTLVASLVSENSDVVVFFTSTADTTAVLEAVARSMEAKQRLFILLAEPFEELVATAGPQMTFPVVSIKLQTGTLESYNNYLNSDAPLSNPYYAQYYMKLFQCNLPGYSTYTTACPDSLANITSNAGYVQDNFVLATINAVYATVDALDRTVRDYCGDAYSAPCSAFLSAADRREQFNLNLADVNFVDEAENNFRFLDREGNVAYDILQSNAQGGYDKVGSYAGVTLDLEESMEAVYTDTVRSECTEPCASCLSQALEFSFIPGDIYLAGIFDVHEGSITPFTCGGIKTENGFLLLEAFQYALNEVNRKKGQFADILPGIQLGGIGLDACESEIRGAYLVSNINNGIFTLTRDGEDISPAKIDAYIGSYGSRATIYLSQVLADLEIPQISFAAGNPTLSDERYYSYLYRTVPSDESMVEGILKFLDTTDIRYVQVVFQETEEAIETKDYFVSMAASYSICVAQAVNYPDIATVSAETANNVVSGLIEKPAANTVVTFLDVKFISAMLEAVERSDEARGRLRFIGSDDWGDNQEAIATAGRQAVNSVTLKIDSDDVEGFEQYINERTLANSEDNPWFDEYYQAIHNCYVSKVDTMGYPEACPLTPSDTINQPGYQQDRGVVYVMDAVYAAAFALHETLKEKCGEDYSAVCQAYSNSRDRRDILLDNIANVNFTDPVGSEFMFVNRSGNQGYRFYTIDSGIISDADYNEIGTYDVTSMTLQLSESYENQVNSNCERVDACAECPLIRDNTDRVATYNMPNAQSGATTIVAFFDIHKQGVDPYRCGEINPAGFQQFLAFFYSIEKVLKETVTGTSASMDGMQIVAIDTCSNSLRVDQDLYGLMQGDGLCNSIFDDNIVLNLGNLGAVLPVGESNTEAASRVLESPQVLYVSPNAVTSRLDDALYLARTIAPDSALIQELVAIFQAMGWTYVDAVYHADSNSYSMVQVLEDYSYDASVCIASQLVVSDEDSDQDVENTLAGLSRSTGSRVVILLGSQSFMLRVLEAASRQGTGDDYLWVLAGQTEDLVVPEGIRYLGVGRRTWPVDSFRTHVNTLEYDNVHNGVTGIPTQWFDEFYQLTFNCTLLDSSRPREADAMCDKTRMFNELQWEMDPYILNTVAATYALGSGLRDVLTDCNCVADQSLGNGTASRANIKDKVLDVTWQMKSVAQGNDFDSNGIDELFEFDKENRWWNQGFVYQLSWDDDETTYSDMDTVTSMLERSFPTSECNAGVAECGCVLPVAEAAAAALTIAQQYQPSDHRNYYKYKSSGERVFDWPIWTIPVVILSCVGIVMTLILFLVLIIGYPVRTGTSILGYVLIFGIVGIYGINFAFFLHATDWVCGIRRSLMGVVYMITFAPLLMKAVDNWRFSRADFAESYRYSGISSACSLLLMTLGLVLIQCIIPTMWLILRHPTATQYQAEGYNMARHDNWWCDPPQDYDLGMVLSFSFVVFIVLVTAGFSALSYDSERNSNESRWTLFCCVVTGGCFLVWMVVTTNAGPVYRDPAIAIANFVNATVLMVVMPLRKSILMCRARDERQREKEALRVMNGNGGGVPFAFQTQTYDNPSYELNDYDNTFIDSKSEEF